ncbi:phage tail tape measure protein [Spirosoma oryzicola]|uniref:phage tail tape measure protein n=1 Tax=Spirosoma oryzicola TaxID=2898794 RepID=UPI001E51795B|nr:phage tail tape measure protein [Spirosoma oryzicola]UHG93421.1 phage tail tape measure protein [Spirosoma oryzicola]
MATQQDKAVIDLVINGKQSETSLYNIKTAAVNAQKALSRMAETDPGYAKQKRELEALLAAQQQRIVKINQEKTAWQRFTADMPSMTGAVTAGNLITSTISMIGSGISSAIANFREFDAASKDLSAVTGATGQDLEFLNKTASRTGPALGKSAAEMLEAYKLMASAKPELLDQKELLVATTEAAITLSQAGKIDLAEATKVTAESLNQFGEGADQANRFINAIAAGANEGSAEIDEMGAALKNSGTVAAAQNVSFEQTNAVLQSLSTIALKGGEAGTQLRNVLLTLGSGSDDTNPKVVGLDKALDNLGKKNLSTAEMTKLFGKENITAAQHIIAHRSEISKMTTDITGTSEAYTQAAKNNASLDHQIEVFSSRMSGLAVLIGTKVMPVVNEFLGGAIDLAKQFTDLLTPAAETATQAFDDQKKKVADLTTNLTPLLDRHDQLKKKTVLTTDEQNELKKIVSQVANVVPGAVTEFDKYGNALGLNTDKAREFIRVQKAMLQYTNKAAIDENKKALTDLQKTQKQQQDLLNSGGAQTIRTILGNGQVSEKVIHMSQEQLNKLRGELAATTAEIQQKQDVVKGLSGGLLDAPTDKPASPATGTGGKPADTGGGGSKGGGLSDDEQKAKDKAERKAEAKITANKRADLAIKEMEMNAIADEEQREMARAQWKSDKEKEEIRTSAADAAKKATWTKGVEDALKVELNEIEEKYTKKRAEEKDKQMELLRKGAEEELNLEKAKNLAKIDEMVANGEMTKEVGNQAKLMVEWSYLQDALALNEVHYQSLAELYEKDAAKKAEIEAKKKESNAKIAGDITKNEGDQATARAEVADAEVTRSKESADQQARDQRELFNRKKEIFNDSVTVLKFFFKENTLVYKAAMLAQQAYALKDVAINYSRAVMGVIAGASTVPFPGNLLAIAKGIAIPTLQMASAVANIRAQKFDAPAFADGGFTNSSDAPSGYTTGPTYYNRKNFIAGEAGTEWIMSAPMLKNPVMANIAGALQALQVSGQYKSMGSVGTSAGANGGSTSQSGGGMSDGLLLAIHQQLQLNNQRMEEMAKRPINQNYFKVREVEDKVDQIEMETSL